MQSPLIKTIQLSRHDSPGQINEVEQQLIQAAAEAAESAYAPYSHFPVGAAVLLEGDIVVKGNNQENMAYPSGLCAERVALFGASANHPGKKILAIAVHIVKSGPDDHFASPCGACRQVMYEYEWKQGSPIRLFLQMKGKPAWVSESAETLLPFPFVLTSYE